jgi:hypothetical protein
MEKQIIVQLHKDFEKSVFRDQQTDMEFWLARDLQGRSSKLKLRPIQNRPKKLKSGCNCTRQAGGISKKHLLSARQARISPPSS